MNRKIFLLLWLGFLLLTWIFYVWLFSSVVGIYGDIGASNVSSYEWDTEEGRYSTAVRLNSSEYYLVAFAGDTGTDYDGFVRTLRVWNSNGTIQQSVVSTFEYDTSYGRWPSICKIPGTDKYAIAYEDDTTTKTTVVTIQVWDTNGTIRPSVIDTQVLNYDGITWIRMINVTQNVFVICHSHAANTLYLETIWINSSGTINNTILDKQESDNGSGFYGIFANIVKIDYNTIAQVYWGSSSDGWMSTWNISSSGAITNTPAKIWEFDNADGTYPTIKKISGSVYAIAWKCTDGDGKIGTITIPDTGMFTASFIDTLEFDIYNCAYPTIFTVNPGSVYGVSYVGNDTDGYIKTMNISSTGTIGDAIIDTLEFETTTLTDYAPVLYVNKTWYLVTYSGDGKDGWSATVSITTNYATPTLSNPDPADGSTGKPLTPALSITAADLNGDAMTLTWSSNSSGSWIQFGSNSSVANGTYRQTNSNFSAYSTKYWWRVNITDGLNTYYAIYSFTTGVIPNSASTMSNENPVNNSIDVNISMVLWNITIEDPDGDLFNWTIQCSGWNISNDNYDSANAETNGSKEVHLGWQPGFPLEYSKVYTVWVNVTDGTVWTKNWYRFTTKSPVYSITLSAEFPGNNSIVVYNLDFGELPPTNIFNMSINRSHDGGLDMNTTIWFDGFLLFTNASWGDGSIAFNLFDYWAGSLVNGSTYNWTVNASEGATVYTNETYSFVFTINVTGGAGPVASVVLFGDPKQSMWIGLCFIFFLTGTLILRSASKKLLKKK